MKQWALHITAISLLFYFLVDYTQFITHAQVENLPTEEQTDRVHNTNLGDTWLAVAFRYGTSVEKLVSQNRTINLQRYPAVGMEISLPAQTGQEKFGRLLRPLSGGTLELAFRNNRSPWTLTLQNDLSSPYSPLFYKPIFLEEETMPPRELPVGLESFELAPGTLMPGSALALHAHAEGKSLPAITLEGEPLIVTRQGAQITALGGTGAFYPPGQHMLQIRFHGQPLWEQPIIIVDRLWNWEEVNYTNSAVLDPQVIRLERERLQDIWDESIPRALWEGSFLEPIEDFVDISSYYGARRSVNGGPYATYHEGTDYSAYGGTPVLAPAAGKVVLAEELAIRGGAVILDHGLGLHSGYYHLSVIHVQPGEIVESGTLLGEVGTTGRSTGNHLHWDLLVGRTWIDPLGWLEQGLDTWLTSEQ
jgi:murein DD-endopeptidase MepM/ murein hydrolase activator NlpD